MISGIRLCWHNKPEHVSCSAGWGWAVNRELLAQNKADDEFTVLFLITQGLQASLKPSTKPTPTQGRKDPRPSLLCSWAVVISEGCWLELAFWGFSHSWEFRCLYPLLLLLLLTWDLKCHRKPPGCRFLCMVTVLSREIWQTWLSLPKGWETPTNLSTDNVLRNLPGRVICGPLKTKKKVQNVLWDLDVELQTPVSFKGSCSKELLSVFLPNFSFLHSGVAFKVGGNSPVSGFETADT